LTSLMGFSVRPEGAVPHACANHSTDTKNRLLHKRAHMFLFTLALASKRVSTLSA
jgi:hypothetical protein